MMNTEVTVQVKGNPKQIIRCAYDTLLTFDRPRFSIKDKPGPHDYISVDLLFASAEVKYTTTVSQSHVCLITVEPSSESNCKMTISADNSFSVGDSQNKGGNIALFSAFLQRFEQRYNQLI